MKYKLGKQRRKSTKPKVGFLERSTNVQTFSYTDQEKKRRVNYQNQEETSLPGLQKSKGIMTEY